MLIHVTDKQEAKILAWLQKSTYKGKYRQNLTGIYKDAKRGLYLSLNGYSLFTVRQDQLPVLADLPDGSIHVLNDNKQLGKSANQYLEAEPVDDTMLELEPVFENIGPAKTTASLYIDPSVLRNMLEMPTPSQAVILRMFVDENHKGMVSVESPNGEFLAFCASYEWVTPASEEEE